MPTPPKTLENIKKHLTNAEKEARQNAEGELKRKKRPQLRCPKWLDDDAREIFEETKKRLKGLEMLDNSDVEMLAQFSNAVAIGRALSNIVHRISKKGVLLASSDDMKAYQAQVRLIKMYASEIGLTPTARARLAKRKAEREPLDPLAQLLDMEEVRDYVNDGNEQ